MEGRYDLPRLSTSNTDLSRRSQKRNNDNVAKFSNELLNEPTTPGKKTHLSDSQTDVFNRLTSVKGYTGTHKLRFNADGTGRGIDGRDAVAKALSPYAKYRGGDVKDLSQILRQ